MANANKQYGSGFETDTVDYLRGRNQVASRIARTVPDEGDVVLGDAEFILQLKANRDANTSASLDLVSNPPESKPFSTPRRVLSNVPPYLYY